MPAAYVLIYPDNIPVIIDGYMSQVGLRHMRTRFKFNFGGKLMVIGEEIFYVNIICTRKNSSKTFRSIFTGGMVEIAPIRSIFIRANLPKTDWNRSPTVVSCNRRFCASRSAGYEDQASAFQVDCEQSLFSSKICGKENKRSKRANVTVSVM